MYMKCSLTSAELTKLFGIPKEVGKTLENQIFKVFPVGFKSEDKPQVFNIVGTCYNIEGNSNCKVELKAEDFDPALPWKK